MSIIVEATSSTIMALWFLLDDFCLMELFVWVLVEFFEIGCFVFVSDLDVGVAVDFGFIVAVVVGVSIVVDFLNWVIGSTVWTIFSHRSTSKQVYFLKRFKKVKEVTETRNCLDILGFDIFWDSQALKFLSCAVEISVC